MVSETVQSVERRPRAITTTATTNISSSSNGTNNNNQFHVPRRKRRASVTTVPRQNKNLKKASVFSPKVHVYDPKYQSPSPQFDRINLSFLSSSGTVDPKQNWEISGSTTTTSDTGDITQSGGLGDSYQSQSSGTNSATESTRTYSTESCDSRIAGVKTGTMPPFYSSAIEMHITASDSSLANSRYNSRTNSQAKAMSKSQLNLAGDVYFSETSIIEKGYIKEENMSKSGEKAISGFFYASPRKYLESAKQPEKKSDSSSETKKSKSDEIEASGAEASGEAEVGEKEESINEVTKSGAKDQKSSLRPQIIVDKSESEYGPTDATGDLTPENELTGFSRSGNSALEKSTGLGASKSSNKGLLGSDVASKPKKRTKSPTSPSSADGDYTYTYKTTDISSQATSFNQTEMYQPPSEGETRSISDKYPESKEQIERNSPVIEEESPSKVSRGSQGVPGESKATGTETQVKEGQTSKRTASDPKTTSTGRKSVGGEQSSKRTYQVTSQDGASKGSSRMGSDRDYQERNKSAKGQRKGNNDVSKSQINSDDSLLSQVIKADKANRSKGGGSQSELDNSKPPSGKSSAAPTRNSRKSNYSIGDSKDSKSVVRSSFSESPDNEDPDKTLTKDPQPKAAKKGTEKGLPKNKGSEASKDPDSTDDYGGPEETRSDLKTQSLSQELKNIRSVSASTTNRGSQTQDTTRSRGTGTKFTSTMEETSKMSNSRDPKGGGSNSTSVNPFEVFSDKTDPSGAEAEKAKAKRPSKSFKRYSEQTESSAHDSDPVVEQDNEGQTGEGDTKQGGGGKKGDQGEEEGERDSGDDDDENQERFMRGGTDQKDQSQASQNSRISSKDPRPASSDESSGEGPRRTTKKTKLRSVTEESKEAGGADDENRQASSLAMSRMLQLDTGEDIESKDTKTKATSNVSTKSKSQALSVKDPSRSQSKSQSRSKSQSQSRSQSRSESKNLSRTPDSSDVSSDVGRDDASRSVSRTGTKSSRSRSRSRETSADQTASQMDTPPRKPGSKPTSQSSDKKKPRGKSVPGGESSEDFATMSQSKDTTSKYLPDEKSGTRKTEISVVPIYKDEKGLSTAGDGYSQPPIPPREPTESGANDVPPEEVEDYRQLDKKIKKEILKRYRDYLDWRERNFILDGVYVSNLSVAYSKANPKLKFAMPPYNALLDPASHTYFRLPHVRRLIRKTMAGMKHGEAIEGGVIERNYIKENRSGLLARRNRFGCGRHPITYKGHDWNYWLADPQQVQKQKEKEKKADEDSMDSDDLPSIGGYYEKCKQHCDCIVKVYYGEPLKSYGKFMKKYHLPLSRRVKTAMYKRPPKNLSLGQKPSGSYRGRSSAYRGSRGHARGTKGRRGTKLGAGRRGTSRDQSVSSFTSDDGTASPYPTPKQGAPSIRRTQARDPSTYHEAEAIDNVSSANRPGSQPSMNRPKMQKSSLRSHPSGPNRSTRLTAEQGEVSDMNYSTGLSSAQTSELDGEHFEPETSEAEISPKQSGKPSRYQTEAEFDPGGVKNNNAIVSKGGLSASKSGTRESSRMNSTDYNNNSLINIQNADNEPSRGGGTQNSRPDSNLSLQSGTQESKSKVSSSEDRLQAPKALKSNKRPTPVPASTMATSSPGGTERLTVREKYDVETKSVVRSHKNPDGTIEQTVEKHSKHPKVSEVITQSALDDDDIENIAKESFKGNSATPSDDGSKHRTIKKTTDRVSISSTVSHSKAPSKSSYGKLKSADGSEQLQPLSGRSSGASSQRPTKQALSQSAEVQGSKIKQSSSQLSLPDIEGSDAKGTRPKSQGSSLHKNSNDKLPTVGSQNKSASGASSATSAPSISRVNSKLSATSSAEKRSSDRLGSQYHSRSDNATTTKASIVLAQSQVPSKSQAPSTSQLPSKDSTTSKSPGLSQNRGTVQPTGTGSQSQSRSLTGSRAKSQAGSRAQSQALSASQPGSRAKSQTSSRPQTGAGSTALSTVQGSTLSRNQTQMSRTPSLGTSGPKSGSRTLTQPLSSDIKASTASKTRTRPMPDSQMGSSVGQSKSGSKTGSRPGSQASGSKSGSQKQSQAESTGRSGSSPTVRQISEVTLSNKQSSPKQESELDGKIGKSNVSQDASKSRSKTPSNAAGSKSQQGSVRSGGKSTAMNSKQQPGSSISASKVATQATGTTSEHPKISLSHVTLGDTDKTSSNQVTGTEATAGPTSEIAPAESSAIDPRGSASQNVSGASESQDQPPGQSEDDPEKANDTQGKSSKLDLNKSGTATESFASTNSQQSTIAELEDGDNSKLDYEQSKNETTMLSTKGAQNGTSVKDSQIPGSQMESPRQGSVVTGTHMGERETDGEPGSQAKQSSLVTGTHMGERETDGEPGSQAKQSSLVTGTHMGERETDGEPGSQAKQSSLVTGTHMGERETDGAPQNEQDVDAGDEIIDEAEGDDESTVTLSDDGKNDQKKKKKSAT
ncbi:uncharacterized protein LOC142341566 [Convolutriloba macropyga]|uniref:uncharacterized protein LOC142341566 n=1 Tax=Convolutriloba macropyga TaxID=536237 RepID=UPI003F52824F